MHGLVRLTTLAASILWCLSCGVLAAADISDANGAARTLNLPATTLSYANPARPKYFAAAGVATFDNTPDDNPVTDAGATLGRVLFYDRQLSLNHSVSCGSCHVQKHAFADPRPVSVGFAGQKTDRNAMSLNDMRFVRAGFFWDERAETLEEAVMQPLFSHVEMGLDPQMLVARLTADTRYTPLFKQAFGTADVTELRVAQALAQFLRSMESVQSKYDFAVAEVTSSTEDFPAFSVSENLGRKIFFDRCTACHHLGTEPQVAVFSMFRSLNNGIDQNNSARDGGRGDFTMNPGEVGSFKASSLRNIEHTAPYMHDGRLATLEDVVEHYSSGVNRHPNLGPVSRFLFSEQEKVALVDFLKTLSDSNFLSDPKFSDPWEPQEAEQEISAGAATQQSVQKNSDADLQACRTALQQGIGIPASATLPWLLELDADHDDKLSREELNEVVSILQKTGAIVRSSRTRVAAARIGRDVRGGSPSGPGPRGRERRPDPDEPANVPVDLSIGDFNGDGEVSTEEAGHYDALLRLMEFGGGGRLEVFLDRFIARFNFDTEQQKIARSQLRSAKLAIAKFSREQDLAVCEELARVLGTDSTTAFQSRVVNRQTDSPTAIPGASISKEQVQEYIWNHDQDGDGFLGQSEIVELSRSLASVPGGFGQMPASAADLEQFTTRVLQFDSNNDGAISPDELPERMRSFAIKGDRDGNGLLSEQEAHTQLRKSAFDQLVLTGIYIGGGFANALTHSRGALDEIDLSEATRAEAKQLIDAHAARLKERVAQQQAEQFLLLQSLHRTKSPVENSSR